MATGRIGIEWKVWKQKPIQHIMDFKAKNNFNSIPCANSSRKRQKILN